MSGVCEIDIFISNYVSAKKRVLDMFEISGNFFIKPSLDKSWEIIEADDDFYILKHGERDGVMKSSVIVKKDNRPIVAIKNKYTMVVALDCVKVCFIFDNSKYIGKMPEY